MSRCLVNPRALAPAEPAQQEPSQPETATQVNERQQAEWLKRISFDPPAPSWEEVCRWIRAGAPGRALEVAERALQVPSYANITITDAEAAIRLALQSNPEFTVKVFAELETAIAKVDSARYSEPGKEIGPMSVSERETMAAAVLNVLFNTSL